MGLRSHCNRGIHCHPVSLDPLRIPQSPLTEAERQQACDRPAITDRWRLTRATTDVPGMAQFTSQSFDHQAYMRPAETTPPWVRIRTVVACDSLDENLRWQELRGRFGGLLAREAIRRLIYELTDVPDTAAWRQRGTHRRSCLQADLTVEDETVAPAASAVLFLPEDGANVAGLQRGCAELILHINFAPRIPTTISGQSSFRRPSYWRKRFEQSLALPAMLADWLKHDLDLETSMKPAAQFGIMMQARQMMTEMVDCNGIRRLAAPYTLNQFTGWAIADADGKTSQELAAEMMLDLSERILHLDGSMDEMTGLDGLIIPPGSVAREDHYHK